MLSCFSKCSAASVCPAVWLWHTLLRAVPKLMCSFGSTSANAPGKRAEACLLLPHHGSEIIWGHRISCVEINGLISLLHQSESCSLHSPNHFIKVNLCHFAQAKYIACMTSFLMYPLPETLGKICKARLRFYLSVSSRCFGFPPLLSLIALSMSSWIKLAWAKAEAEAFNLNAWASDLLNALRLYR